MVDVVEGDEHFYRCHDGRELRHIRTEHHKKEGYTQTFEVYGCADCSGCEHKANCLYRYDEERDRDKNKVMKINENWEELKQESHANIQSEQGIRNRQIRSIQTEGHFGDIKENENFRRFSHRSSEKVYKEFMLYAIGRNINKYHRFLNGELKKYEGKTDTEAAETKIFCFCTGSGDFCAQNQVQKRNKYKNTSAGILQCPVRTAFLLRCLFWFNLRS